MLVEEIRITCRVKKSEKAALEAALKKGQSPIPLPKGYKFTKVSEAGSAPDEEIVEVFFQRIEQTDEKGKPI